MHFLNRLILFHLFLRIGWKIELVTQASVNSENIFLPEISVARSLPVWTVASLGQFQPYWLPNLLSEDIIWIFSFLRQPLPLSKFSHQWSLHRGKIYLFSTDVSLCVSCFASYFHLAPWLCLSLCFCALSSTSLATAIEIFPVFRASISQNLEHWK